MFYISAASTISHQPTFKNAGFSDRIDRLGKESTLVNPDFKEYIDAGLLRRMSKILRMSVACAKDCLVQAGIEQPDSIVVGTGLGCLLDTEKFLNNFLTIEGLLPPTAFIQSTHNTIAGQISLSLGNHGYNMTHTQNSLSFEHALQDAMLLLGEEDEQVLVGAADEYIEILDEIGAAFNLGLLPLTSASSFFLLSCHKTGRSVARIADVETIGGIQDPMRHLNGFLKRNGMDANLIDRVFFSHPSPDITPSFLPAYFPETVTLVNYQLYSGLYATNSAFGLHFAIDQMQSNPLVKNVLICNHLRNNNLGLSLLQSLET